MVPSDLIRHQNVSPVINLQHVDPAIFNESAFNPNIGNNSGLQEHYPNPDQNVIWQDSINAWVNSEPNQNL